MNKKAVFIGRSTIDHTHDTLGAGDVLHGAFCHYLVEGYNRKEALHRAALIASGSCCYFGTHTWKTHK